ncbi:MAG: CBS domain-containing protein [Candidatus Bathyarchaeota archaeon]
MVSRVRDIMVTDVTTVESSATALDAAKVMGESGVGSVVVLESSKPVGILTERDFITKIVSKEVNPAEVKVSDFMSKLLITVLPDVDISSAASMMSEHGINRLPVVSDGKLLGIVSAKTLLENITKYISSLFAEYMTV